MRIVVPSHGRVEQLRSLTWPLLERLGLAGQAVIVVAESQLATYDAAFPGQVVRGELGLVANRNAVASMFPAGTHVLSMDDDLRDIKAAPDAEGGYSRSVSGDEFADLCCRGFGLLEEFHGAMWGINPSVDRRFLAGGQEYSVGALNVEGCMFGFISGRGDLTLPPNDLGSFDDMERICKLWYAGWNVVRFNRAGHDQSKAGAGGKGAALRQNLCDEVRRIVELYPRVAQHQFGNLPNQSKCRPGIRRRSSVPMPVDLTEVDALRAKIMAAPLPPLPDLHDVDYVPDVERRASEVAIALSAVDLAVWSLLGSSEFLPPHPLASAAERYLCGDGTSREIRLAIQREYPSTLGPAAIELRKSVLQVQKAEKLMKWDIRVR